MPLFQIAYGYMKLNRTGAYRNRGTLILTSDDLTKRTKWTLPTWSHGEVSFSTSGNDRGARYHYGITLTAAELINLLECALPKLDYAARAVGAGATAALRELLVPKEAASNSKMAA